MKPQEQEDWRIRLFKSDIWSVLNAVLTPAESAMLDNFITTEIERAKAEERERIKDICLLHRLSAWSPHDPSLEQISKGSKMTVDAIIQDIDTPQV